MTKELEYKKDNELRLMNELSGMLRQVEIDLNDNNYITHLCNDNENELIAILDACLEGWIVLRNIEI